MSTMELKIQKKLDRRLMERTGKGKSLAEHQSASYYLEDLERCLHRQLKSLEDACSSVKRTGERVYGVYLRNLSGQVIEVKIGKGYVSRLPNGKIGIRRDATASGTHAVLLDEKFIPCDSELSAEILEYYMQFRLGSTARHSLPMWIQKQVQNRFEVKMDRWLEPDINPKTLLKGGREEFNFSDIWDERINVFLSLLDEFIAIKNIGRKDFNDIKHDHQDKGSDLLADYMVAVGDPINAIKDMKDFWMLIKPRGGKNTTTLLGICKFIERMIGLGNLSRDSITDVLFTGLWPSAFEGAQNDIDDYHFTQNTQIGYVDTKSNDWLSQRQQLIKQGCNIIIVFASLQSIDSDINDELIDNYKLAEQEDIEQEELDLTKLEEIKKLGIKYAIIDECDHGIRTKNSKKVLSELDFDLRIQLSGSDLYALKNEIQEEPKNYFSWTILEEMEDIDNGKIKRPLLKRCSLNVKGDGQLPFDGLTPQEMNAKGYSRRILNMFDTHTNSLVEGAKNRHERRDILKIKFNEVDGLIYDGQGNIITFKQTIEIDRLLDRLVASENTGISIFEYQHIFNTVPTRLGGMALYNHIKQFRKDINHKVKTGWHPEFKQARRIEKSVKRWMGVVEGKREGTEKTIFITVGRMLRGASCPWSCVLRMDDYVDFKLGHQIELRAQNSYGPDGKHCLVFDANPWRAMAYPADIAKYNTTGSDMNETLSTKCNRLIPFMLGDLEAEQATEQEVIDSYMVFRSIKECFASSKVFNEKKLRENKEIFEKVDPHKSDKSERDERAGNNKTGNTKGPKPGVGQPRDKEFEKLLAKAKAVSTNLPYLQYLNEELYLDIEKLFENTDKELLGEWADYIGLERNFDLDKLLSVFDMYEINHQLLISSVKIKEGIKIQDIIDLNRKKKGDVVVGEHTAKRMVDKLPVDWTDKSIKVLDPACGRGEILSAVKAKMEKAGWSKELIERGIVYADRSQINITTTKKVLGIGIGFCYNTFKELENWTNKMNTKFDIIIGNPPFKKDTGNSDQLYPLFLNKGMTSMLKDGGYLLLITPPTWTGGTNQLTDQGRINLLEKAVEQHNLIELDYLVNNAEEFKKIGSQFVISLIQAYKGYTGKTKFTDKEGNEFYVDLRGIGALPDSRKVSEEYLRVYIKMQTKSGDKFYFKFNGNKPLTYVDKKDADNRYEYVNASSNHDRKFSTQPNLLGDRFVHSCYLGSKFKFELIENYKEVSVMQNARTWSHPSLKGVSKDVIDSIFESDFFKTYVYPNKFTQYNEMALINKLAIPPLDRVWDSEQLKKWYTEHDDKPIHEATPDELLSEIRRRETNDRS